MRTILSLLLAPLFLYAENPADNASLSSANAAYDGNTLVLTGHVLLDHGLGKMAADLAKLERQEPGKDFPFSLIHLQKNVKIALKTDAEVRCDHADFDFAALKGVLFSQEEDRVVYSDMLKKKKGEKAAFQLMGKTVELGLSKKEQAGKKSDFEIETVLAKENVLIDYAQSFTLRAGQALYRRGKNPVKKGNYKEFQGTVTAYPQDEKNPCLLTHEGDLVVASAVDMDLIRSKISLLHPKGSLVSAYLPGIQKGELRFACKHLTWDHLKNILTLKGDVHIMENVLGDLTSDGVLEITQEMQKEERLLKTVRCAGNTRLLFNDSSQTVHQLISHGSFLFDRQHLAAFLESPMTDGITHPEQQLYYETQNMGLFADKARMDYAAQDGHIRPAAVQLAGGIRLFSLDSELPRYALGDRLSFSTMTRTLILSSLPGRKVLFWDESQSLRIAAEEVHITQDPKTGKESVQGIGCVQFTFSDEENNLLKKVFPHYKPPAAQ